MHRDLIEKYADGAEKLSLAIRGLTREDLGVEPPADAKVGLWTIRQVVIHIVDTELVVADRMKRVIAEDNPTLLAFDENKWAAALMYDKQPADDAVRLMDAARHQMAGILRRLPDNAFERFGTHNKAGKKTLLDLVRMAINHMEHHVKFIHAKREWMGKEMW